MFIVEGVNHTYVLHSFKRDIIQIIRDLIGDPKLQWEMEYAPQRHWTSIECLKRIYNEMWTGDWWWTLQVSQIIAKLVVSLTYLQQELENELDESGTIAALIISSDKSCVSTLLNGKHVYPVYVTLGNISKRARRQTLNRAVALLGYLPVEPFKDEPKATKSRLRQEAVHTAMREMLQPLRDAWRDGVEMRCADGHIRRVHPTMAAFEGDWPELCDMAKTLASACPKCDEPPARRGQLRRTRIRNPDTTLATLLLYDDPNVLKRFGLRPGWLFWANLYPTNFHECIAPDLLHQV